MKITDQHYQHIVRAFALVGRVRANELRAAIQAENKAQDTEMRLRWDIATAAGLDNFVCDEIYKYANDDHLDTAYRHAMRELAF